VRTCTKQSKTKNREGQREGGENEWKEEERAMKENTQSTWKPV
jgi:hypothetical protein